MADPRTLDITFQDQESNKIKLVIRNIARRMAREDFEKLEGIRNAPSDMLALWGQSITPQQAQNRRNALMQCLRGDTDIFHDIVFDVAQRYIDRAKIELFGKIKPL